MCNFLYGGIYSMLKICQECEHFVSEKAIVNEYALKRFIWHHISDITENAYTDRPISWLLEEIEKKNKMSCWSNV